MYEKNDIYLFSSPSWGRVGAVAFSNSLHDFLHQDGNPAAKASEVWSLMHCVPS